MNTSTVRRNYKFRIYPHRAQERALRRMFAIHCSVWNDCITERDTAWRMGQHYVGLYGQTYQLNPARREDPDLAWCNFGSLQRTMRRVDEAYRAFFKGLRGHPHYCSADRWTSVEYSYGDGARLVGDRLLIQNVGSLRMFYDRPIPTDAAIKTVRVMRDGGPHWYAVFSIERHPVESNPGDEEIGIDMGYMAFAALSTGEVIPNPRWYREAQEKLGVLNQRKARCKRGSNQYRALGRQIAKLSAQTAARRSDFQHKLSTVLAQRARLIAVEELNVAGLAKSRMAKSAHDAE